MKVIYIADDGKEFDDEYECEDYEWKLNHPNLKYIHLYDVNGNELNDVLSEESYNNSERIVVTNKDSVKELKELAKYSGYCAYESINECGEWVFDYNKETFVKA